MVKVADFGLSRDVYVSDYYVMRHSIPLPVKWLAPEALFDRVFAEKTDVVSSLDRLLRNRRTRDEAPPTFTVSLFNILIV